MLEFNQKEKYPFLTKGTAKVLIVKYLSEYYFDSRKRTRRINSKRKILFEQTLEVVEFYCGDNDGFDMSHDEFQELFREAWKVEKGNYLYTDR